MSIYLLVKTKTRKVLPRIDIFECFHRLKLANGRNCKNMYIFLQFNLFFFILKKISCIPERDRERSKDIDRGRSRLLAGSLMWDSIHRPGIMP